MVRRRREVTGLLLLFIMIAVLAGNVLAVRPG